MRTVWLPAWYTTGSQPCRLGSIGPSVAEHSLPVVKKGALCRTAQEWHADHLLFDWPLFKVHRSGGWAFNGDAEGKEHIMPSAVAKASCMVIGKEHAVDVLAVRA